MTMKLLKKSRFFPADVIIIMIDLFNFLKNLFIKFLIKIRNKISDFGVVFTIATAVLIDYYVGIDTPKLLVPLKFEVKEKLVFK
jgi:hypothetical protein